MMRCDLPGPGRNPIRHYSGILVLAPPANLPACIGNLDRLAGVEVHHQDPKTGKIIAVLESTSLEEQELLLQRVRTSPHVLLAELVYYRRDEESEDVTSSRDESETKGRTGS